jgi:hypothetical protein
MPWTNSPFLPSCLRRSSICGHRVDADELQQHDVVGEARLEPVLRHRVAAVLDDDGLAVEAADVRQRLGEDLRLLGGLVAGQCH